MLFHSTRLLLLTLQSRFYVNIYTKKSQWGKPTAPAQPPDDSSAPDGPPPSYMGSGALRAGDKKDPLPSNNPYQASSSVDEDARLAAKLQAEEEADARSKPGSATGNRDAMQDYQNTPLPARYDDQPLPPRPQDRGAKGGFLGKLLGKASGGSSHPPPQAQQGYGQQYNAGPAYGGAGYGGYPPPQQGYGYGPPQPGYGPPPGGYYGGGGGYAQQPPPKKSGGLGTMGGAALGLGGGLLGGALIGEAIESHDQNEYQQGYDQGNDNNDYGGGGYDDGGGGFDDGGGF